MSNEVKFPPPAEASDCLAPQLGSLVFDYADGLLPEDEESEFEAHMLYCDKCYQVTAALDWVRETLKSGLKKAEHPQSSHNVTAGDTRANHISLSAMDVPLRSPPMPTLYVVVGGLGAIGLVALGAIGISRLYKLKRTLFTHRKVAL